MWHAQEHFNLYTQPLINLVLAHILASVRLCLFFTQFFAVFCLFVFFTKLKWKNTLIFTIPLYCDALDSMGKFKAFPRPYSGIQGLFKDFLKSRTLQGLFKTVWTLYQKISQSSQKISQSVSQSVNKSVHSSSSQSCDLKVKMQSISQKSHFWTAFLAAEGTCKSNNFMDVWFKNVFAKECDLRALFSHCVNYQGINACLKLSNQIPTWLIQEIWLPGSPKSWIAN